MKRTTFVVSSFFLAIAGAILDGIYFCPRYGTIGGSLCALGIILAGMFVLSMILFFSEARQVQETPAVSVAVPSPEKSKQEAELEPELAAIPIAFPSVTYPEIPIPAAEESSTPPSLDPEFRTQLKKMLAPYGLRIVSLETALLDPHKLSKSGLPIANLPHDPKEEEVIAYAQEHPQCPEFFIVVEPSDGIQTPCIATVKEGKALVTYRRPDPAKKTLTGLSPWEERYTKGNSALGIIPERNLGNSVSPL